MTSAAGSHGPAEVEAVLQTHGISYRRFTAKASRATEAAQSLGVELGAVVKSLLFLVDSMPALILIGGDRRADPARLQEELHARRVMIASRRRVTEETGYPPGAVPPIGHARSLPTWLDRGLVEHETVYVSGGATDVMIGLAFEDLLRLTQGQVIDVADRGSLHAEDEL